jgi:hypothetical protein
VTDEEIMWLWNKAYTNKVKNINDHIFTFARLIQQKQQEIDAALCENLGQFGCDVFAAAIRSQKP